MKSTKAQSAHGEGAQAFCCRFSTGSCVSSLPRARVIIAARHQPKSGALAVERRALPASQGLDLRTEVAQSRHHAIVLEFENCAREVGAVRLEEDRIADGEFTGEDLEVLARLMRLLPGRLMGIRARSDGVHRGARKPCVHCAAAVRAHVCAFQAHACAPTARVLERIAQAPQSSNCTIILELHSRARPATSGSWPRTARAR